MQKNQQNQTHTAHIDNTINIGYPRHEGTPYAFSNKKETHAMKDAQEQTNFTITKSDQAKISQQVEDLLIRMSRDGSSIPFRNAIDAAHALGYAAISPILAIITEQENVYAAALYSLAHALRKDHGAELADDMVSQGTLDWLETYRQNRRESALATMQKIFQSQ